LRALNNVAAQAGNADRWAEVIELSRQGLELARRVGDRLWEQSFQSGDLEEHVNLGRWDEAEERARQLRPDAGLPEYLRISALNLVPMRVWRGELDEARHLLEAFPEAESSEDVQTRTAYRRSESQVLRAEGRLPEALAAGEEAFSARVEFGIQAGIVKEGLVQALEAAFDLGDEGKMDELLGHIEALRPGEVTPYLRTQGARFAAKLAARRGESDRVESGFAAAVAGFRELSMPFHVAVTQLELGEWLVSSDRAEEARGLFTEAREVFERLRARPWIEQVDRVAEGIAAEAHA
jgi:tetratricopeptide (TPR) repeat protein